MKKNVILATAIAAAMSVPMVQADSTIYGALHQSIDSVDVTGGDKNIQVNDNTSKIGFKGSEDLGNGLTATYQIELGVVSDGDTGGNGPFGSNTRNTYAGLKGGFGEVRIGRHDVPAKAAFYAAGNDHMGDSAVDLNRTFGFVETRSNDVVAYLSNNMGGVKFMVAMVPGEGSGAANAPGDGFADGTSAAVMYSGGGLKLAAGILDAADVAGVSDLSVTNLGGSYKMGDLTVGINYQMVEVPANEEATIFALSGAYQMGKNTLYASFGNSERDNNGVTTDGDVMNIGIKHAMSKRTSVFAGYSSVDAGAARPSISDENITNAAETTTLTAGLLVKF